MREIQLTQGYAAQVDDADYERCIEGYKWCAAVFRHKDGSIKVVYAVRKFRKPDGIRTPQYMHRFLLGVTDPEIEVDHKDSNGLHNGRKNLRSATKVQNGQSLRLSTANTSGYKGVSWNTNIGKWKASISVNGQSIHLGYFTDILDAARAYDAAALKYHGTFAKTNFMQGLLPNNNLAIAA